MAGEDDDAVEPGCVPDLRASQEELVGSEGDLLGRARGRHKVDGTFVGVEGVVWVLGADRASQRGDMLWRSPRRGLWGGLLDLEIGLAVDG